MKLFRSVITCVLLAMPSALAAQQAADLPDRIDGVFERWNSAASAGCAVGVSRDGRKVVSRAYGMADLEHDIRNTPSTIFEAGSVSKQFTAAAVMLLVQDGLIGLNDDVRRHVPELPDYGDTIRIRHLLNHTSGLRDWGSVAAIAGAGREARTHTHDHVLDILGRQRALNFAPGSEYSYSNSGYNLLAIIVARVSGMPFAEFSRTRIFEPLGLRDTQWRDDYRRIVKHRASAYAMRGGRWVIDRPIEDVHGNGGLLTTAADLLSWNDALAGGALGGNELVARMHTRGVLNSGRRIDYAAGLFITSLDDVPEISHTGSTAGYRAFLARYPEQRVGVAVLCNAGNANPGQVGRAVARLVLGTRPAVAAPAPQSRARPTAALRELTAGEMQALTGEYYSPDAETTLRVSVEEDRLVIRRRPADRLQLVPLDDDLFVAQSLGRVRFIRDEGGRVIALSVQQARVYDMRFERVQ